VSEGSASNSYIEHRGSSSGESESSTENSYIEHRGDSSAVEELGCEDDCDDSNVIEDEGPSIVGEVRTETIDDEEDDGPAPFVISEVRTGIGTSAEDDWDDVLVEDEEGDRQGSTEPESTPRSQAQPLVGQSSPPYMENKTRPQSSSMQSPLPHLHSQALGVHKSKVVQLSPPREVRVEPEVRLLPVFQSSFAGVAPRQGTPKVMDPPTVGAASGSRKGSEGATLALFPPSPGRCRFCGKNFPNLKLHATLHHGTGRGAELQERGVQEQERGRADRAPATKGRRKPPGQNLPTSAREEDHDPHNIDIYLDDDDNEVEALD